MTRRLLAATAFFILAVLAAAPAGASLETSEDLQRAAEAFHRIGLDASRAHDVTNATITRDIGTLRLQKGVLIFSTELEGITPIAVFVGQGSFTLTPVRKMDREMLDIAGKEHLVRAPGGMINTEISEVYLLSFDNAWDELKPALSQARAATQGELKAAQAVMDQHLHLDDKLDFGTLLGAVFSDTAGQEVGGAPELDLIARALDQPFGWTDFRAEVKTADYGWLCFAWMPRRTSEVRLGTRESVGTFLDYHPLVVTHRKSDLDQSGRYAADPNADLKEVMKVKHYQMEVEVPDLERIEIEAAVTLTPMVAGLRMLPFSLANDVNGPKWDSHAKYIDVLSVTDSQGKPLPWLHRKHLALVLLPEAAEAGKDYTVNFKLDERTITQFSANHYSLLNTWPWFPQYGYLGGRYEFDWTVKTVKPLVATGSGKVLKTWEEANLNAVQMMFDRPVQFPSIIFGRYDKEEGEIATLAEAGKIQTAAFSAPRTTFYIMNPEICRLPGVRCPIPIDVTVPRKKPENVLAEAGDIIKLYEDLYGPFPYEKLDVAQMSPGMGFGQAPPAFVQLTGEAFMSSSALADSKWTNPDFFHEFFAHEVAHQWWGHKIGWIADEDAWLSEAFAEYSSALYVLALQGKQRYLEKIREWEENAKNGDPHGSIAWCNNVSGPNGFQWRTDLIYNKGPYVVHMLRMQMGMDDFKKAMKALFEKYAYTNITTYELQRECEKAVGYSLDFFFDQWFRGTGIPVFDYSWDSEETEEGKHLVTVRISQRDKENFKIVLMPISFYFRGQDEPMIRPRPILVADDEYKLLLPEKPARIVLDEDHDILGDVIPHGSGAGS